MPSPLVGEGYTGARHKLAWVRGWLRKHSARGENPSSGASRHLLPQGEKEDYAAVKNGSGAPSVDFHTTFTFWPIFRLVRSQSTMLVCTDGPSFNVT
jgi:hypothetical protein